MIDIELSIEEMEVIVKELEDLICYLWKKDYNNNKVEVKGLSRKEMVMSIIKDGRLFSVKDVSRKMSEVCGKEISCRNVSSLLSYIRDEVEKNNMRREKGGKIDMLYDGELVRVGRGVGKLKWVKN